MNDFHSHRWNPGFIAMRWRHVFWILPLAGLLIGIAIYVLDYQRKNVATSIVQLRPSIPSFGFPECFTLIKSDEVLEATSRELKLPVRWNMDSGQTVNALRRLVVCGEIRGTSLMEISIKGRKSPETVELCTALTRQTMNAAEAMKRKHNENVSQMADAELDRMDLRIASLQKDLSEVSHLAQQKIGSERSTDSSIKAIEKNLADAQKDRDDFLGALLHNRYPSGLRILNESPLIDHEFPSMISPAVPVWERLRAPGLACGFGISFGILSSVILAYLLELVFPRKRDGEMANPV